VGSPVLSAGNWSLFVALVGAGFSTASPSVIDAILARPAVIIGLGAADWYVGSPSLSYVEITVSAPPRAVKTDLVSAPTTGFDRRQRMAVLDPNRYGADYGISQRRAELILERSKRRP
jgi:hypothetical protein